MKRPSDKTDNKGRPIPSEVEAQQQSLVAGRDTMSLKWLENEHLKIIHMVGDLDLSHVSAHTREIREMMEREYPELLLDTPIGNDTSGRAYRMIRSRAETKARHRRVAYDEGLVRAHQMAIVMGAMRGYPDFAGFSVNDWQTDKLDHRIDPERSVLQTDPMDEVEYNQAFYNAAIAATTAGVPLEVYLRKVGWSKEDVAEVVRLNKEKDQAALDRQRLSGQKPGGNLAKPKGSTLNPPTNIEIQRSDGKKGNPSLPAMSKN